MDIRDLDAYDIRPYRNCTVCDVFKWLEWPATLAMVVFDIEAIVRGCVDVVGYADQRMIDAADVCREGGQCQNLV